MSSEVTVGKGKGFLNPHFKISTDVGQSCWPYPKHRSQHQNRSLDDTASQSWCVIRTFSDATLKASRIKSPCFLFAKVLQGKWPKAMTTMTWSRILTFIYDLSPFAHLFGSSFPLGDGLWFPAYHLMPCSWYEGAVFFKLPANVSEVQGIKTSLSSWPPKPMQRLPEIRAEFLGIMKHCPLAILPTVRPLYFFQGTFGFNSGK